MIIITVDLFATDTRALVQFPDIKMTNKKKRRKQKTK